MATALEGAQGRWLDFGANTSPYGDLLAQAELESADIQSGPGVTYVIPPGGSCPAPDVSFDGILSTQVLEHVGDVQRCLLDLHRMLKPWGRLVLTTHGIWEDHACPYDYRRWTADGLQVDLERAGFTDVRCLKVTTGIRALLQIAFLVEHQFLYQRRSTPIGMALHLIGRMLGRYRARINRYADHALADFCSSDRVEPRIYIALLATATKKADAKSAERSG